MDFFGKFRRPKSELQNTTGEIDSRLFPGGRDEMLFNAKTVAELGNGKIGIEAAAHLCGSVKRSLFSAVAKFDGRKNLGPNAKQLAGKVQEETGGKLNSAEAAAVVLYLFVDCFFSVVPSV